MNSGEERSGDVKKTWLIKGWEYISTFLAILGLIDVTKQFVEWAALIHEASVRYAVIREWLFAHVPLSVPTDWHNTIVLSLVLFGVANIGFYRRTGDLFICGLSERIKEYSNFGTEDYKFRYYYPKDGIDSKIAEWSAVLSGGLFVLLIIIFVIMTAQGIFTWPPPSEQLKAPLFQLFIGIICIFVLVASGILLAWKWLFGTAAVFGTIFTINEIYVHWLAAQAT